MTARNAACAALLTALLCTVGCAGERDALSEADRAQHNRAVGLMGQYRNEEAHALLAQLVARHPGHVALRTDLAIAMLNRQQEGDEERALAIAEEAMALNRDAPRPRYVAGLAELYLGRVEQAAPRLRAVTEADPSDAHAAYFAAQALAQTGDESAALTLYRRAIEIDPYQRSAYYAAALLLRKHGDADAARALLADYQRLQGNPRAHLAEFRYGRMGPKAMVQALHDSPARPSPMPPGALFAASETLHALPTAGDQASLITADLDADGRQDLLLAGASSLVMLGNDDGYRTAAEHPLSGQAGIVAAASGDFDNDGALDVALCRDGAPPELRSAADGWAQALDLPGLTDATPCRDAQWLDIDHDGDLDLAVIGASGSSDVFSNNLDGSFRRLSDETDAASLRVSQAAGWVAGDLDADRDVDLALWTEAGRLHRLRNDRLWRFAADQAPVETGWQAATLIDIAAEGHPQLVGVDADGAISALAAADVGSRPLGHTLLDGGPRRLAAADFDGDGTVDLLVWNAQGFEVWRVREGAALTLMHREDAALRALVPVIEDSRHGPSLLGVADQGAQRVLQRWAPGPGRGRFLTLDLSGRSDTGEGMRSNASGLGARVMLRRGDHWSIVERFDRSSSAGQSLQPLALGLGGADAADFVSIDWSDGVMQTELQLEAGAPHRIVETQRQLASCPVLFAWNGEGYTFVSDLLGVGGIGFLLAPGEYAPSRPWEYFRLPDGVLQPRDGALWLQIAEPMEEVAYLDQLRLHVYDLPPGWNLTLDERMATGEPAPSGAPLFFRDDEVAEFATARTHTGNDLGEALRHADGVAADPGPVDARFLGRLERDLEITLELDVPPKSGGTERLALLAEGWVEYPYSQTLFAAWQAGAAYRPFGLEQRSGDAWRTVYPQFGYPAGMPRQMALPLPDSIAGADALRLRGNLEVYWDRLALVRTRPAPRELDAWTLEPRRAVLRRIGFPKRTTLAQKRPQYEFAQRLPFWDTRYPEGEYTAFGAATPLVADLDDAFAIVGPGDALEVAFDATPSPPEGWRRVFVLEVRGYAKDMDLYTGSGGSVGPLPRTPGIAPSTEAATLHTQHNHRFQAGF